MHACDASSKIVMQLCLQNFYSNTRFQILNFKYFCRILRPLNRATKFLENSKTAVLFYFLWPICKRFFSDSSWKMFLVILSFSTKSFMNFRARKDLGFDFQNQTIVQTFPFAQTHLLALSPSSRFSLPRRLGAQSFGATLPHLTGRRCPGHAKSHPCPRSAPPFKPRRPLSPNPSRPFPPF